MTQSDDDGVTGMPHDMTPERAAQLNSNPRRIHAAEQMYAEVNRHLDKIIKFMRDEQPKIYAQSNDDASCLFDWIKAYMMEAERRGGIAAHRTTFLMCAAALTRLVRAPRTNDVLAQLETELGEMNNDDDH